MSATIFLPFGRGSEGARCLGAGWSHIEPDLNWTIADSCALTLPVPAGPGNLILELVVTPLLYPPLLLRQRLIIRLDGEMMMNETVRCDAGIAVELDEAEVASRTRLELTLHCPDSIAPVDYGISTDDRQLGVGLREALLIRTKRRPPFMRTMLPSLMTEMDAPDAAVMAITGLTLQSLAMQFESLGHNCEAGLIQRHMGAEPISLLRFAGIQPSQLLHGLDFTFEGIEAPENLSTFIGEGGQEFMVQDRRYGTLIHSDRFVTQVTHEEVLAMFHRSLRFLREKFAQDLRDGRKIFVFQHPGMTALAQIRPILNLLRSHGPNALLFVTDDGTLPSGAVEQIEVDLFHGVVERLAPTSDAGRFELRPWISVMANAYRLWRTSGGGC